MIAFVSLRDQLVDFAIGDLRQNPVAFSNGEQNRVQHGVNPAHDLGVGTLEILGLAALGELPVSGGINQPRQLLL